MTYWGWDYAWWRPTNAQLKSNKVQFVCRYLSYDNTGKNLTKAEYNNLLKQGVAVVLNWEYATNAALNGKAQGVKDAKAAEAQRKAIGAPAAPIYFSCDWDATPAQQTPINAYLDGAASVIGRNRVGVYGSYYVVKRAMEAGKAKWGWQTYAWSGGQVYSKAHIYQYQNGVMSGNADRNRSLQDNFGQIKPDGTVANSTNEGLSFLSNKSDFIALLKDTDVREAWADLVRGAKVRGATAEAVWQTDGYIHSPSGDKDNPFWQGNSFLTETYKRVQESIEAAKSAGGVTIQVDPEVLKTALAEVMTSALAQIQLTAEVKDGK